MDFNMKPSTGFRVERKVEVETLTDVDLDLIYDALVYHRSSLEMMAARETEPTDFHMSRLHAMTEAIVHVQNERHKRGRALQ